MLSTEDEEEHQDEYEVRQRSFDSYSFSLYNAEWIILADESQNLCQNIAAKMNTIAQIPEIARLLKEAGYSTALTGKWHLGYEAQFAPNLHGFDYAFYCTGGGMDYY